MKLQTFRTIPKLLPLAALLLACGFAHAANPPRVMFVSGVDVQPVLIDLQGKEVPAKKGQVIPPGFSVKVPEGATLQIMTDEKAIVAVRQNSLLRLEKLGDGDAPHKFKLDSGGLRVATPDKGPKKFEVDTPNAKLTFDKGDHEAYFLPEDKQQDGQWGTLVRGLRDASTLTTKEGNTTIDNTVVGYVPGSAGRKVELIDRNRTGEIPLSGTGPASTLLLANQKALGANVRDGSNQSGSKGGTGAVDPTKGLAGRGLDSVVAPLPSLGNSRMAALSNSSNSEVMASLVARNGLSGSAMVDNVAIKSSVAAAELKNPAMMGTSSPAMLAVVAQPAFSNTLSRGTITSTTTPRTAITVSTSQVPKDLFIDPTTRTPVLLMGDKVSLPTRTLAEANKLAPISLKEIPPAPKTPPPVVGAPIVTKEQQISTISKTLSTTRNLKLR